MERTLSNDVVPRSPTRKRVDDCYLCGQKLTKPRSKDHLPPQCFFPSVILEEIEHPQFWTLPTHESCNNAYKNDEEYFVETMRLRVGNSWAGGALQIDFMDRVTKREESQRLFGKAFRELRWQHFATASSTGGMLVGIDHDEARVNRVCWKIVRGLFFRECGVILPADLKLTFTSLGAESQAEDGLATWWKEADGEGRYPYPRVFEYRFKSAQVSDTGEEQWMLRMWDDLIWWTSFWRPDAG